MITSVNKATNSYDTHRMGDYDSNKSYVPYKQTVTKKEENKENSLDSSKADAIVFAKKISDTNEVVGIIQTAQVALKKVEKNANNLLDLNTAYHKLENTVENRAKKDDFASAFINTRAEIDDITANTSFMENPIFGNRYEIAKDTNLDILNPSNLATNIEDRESITNMIDHVGNQQKELKNALKTITSSITAETNKIAGSAEERFDPNNIDFKNLFI